MKIDKEVLRDYFVEDFHKLGRVHDILDGWAERLAVDVAEHFGGKGYEIYPSFRELMKGGAGAVAVNLMDLWVRVPEDVAAKIMVFGEVPDLSELHKTPDVSFR